MPFQSVDGGRLDRIHLIQRAPGTWQLAEPFSYLEAGRPESERIQVHAHDANAPSRGANASDLASVPPFLWGLISSHGRHTSSALMHDQLWWECLDDDHGKWIEKRREADRLFRVSLRENHTSAVRAALMWSFVVLERFSGARLWQAIVMGAQIAVGILAVYASAAGFFSWWGIAVALVPIPLSFVWRRDWEAVADLTYLGAIIAPFALVALVGQYLLAGLEIAGWILGGRRGPGPRRGPVGLTRPAKARTRKRVREAGE